MGALTETIKLQIDLEIAPEGAQLAHEILVTRDTYAVRVNHNCLDALLFRQFEDLDQLWMNSRFATAELHHVRVALILDDGIQHTLHLVEGREAPNVGIGEAGWAAQVAG